MTTASLKNKHTVLKKKSIQRFPGLSTVTYKEKKCFFRNNYFLDHLSFIGSAISLSFFCAPFNNFQRYVISSFI